MHFVTSPSVDDCLNSFQRAARNVSVSRLFLDAMPASIGKTLLNAEEFHY